MGTLTFTQLQDEVRASLGNRTDLDTRLPRIVNLAQQRLARMHDFDEMEVISTTTVANTGSDNDRFLTLPTVRDVYSIVLLDGANSRRINGRTVQFMDSLLPKPEYWSRDRPTDYVVWGNTLEFFPMPNATYTLRMRWTQWPSDLVAGTDISQFNQKDEILVELSLVYAYRSLGKEEEAAKHERTLTQLFTESSRMDAAKPDIQITPGTATPGLGTGMGNEYWNNPFVKSGGTGESG